MEIILTGIIISLSIYFGLSNVADSIIPLDRKISKNILGQIKKSQIIKKDDEIDNIIKDIV